MDKNSQTSANQSQETNPKSDSISISNIENSDPIDSERAALIVHPASCDGDSIRTSV